MLRYTEICVSEAEVLGEESLCIYISGCKNSCKNCHYSLLQNPQYGDLLQEYFEDMLFAYLPQITCVCFLGEGESIESTRKELLLYVEKSKQLKLKTCIYLGRDVDIRQEPWLLQFDYLKTGAYIEEYGDLSKSTTNQRFYKIENKHLINVTGNYYENQGEPYEFRK